MRGNVALAMVATCLLLQVAAPWQTAGLGPEGPASVGTGDLSLVGDRNLDPVRTRASDNPGPQGFGIVSPNQMSYRLLDHRDVVFPPGYSPDFGPGLIVTDYPWGQSTSFTPGLTSPYETRLTVYNYSSDTFRTHSYNASWGGGFTSPGDITAVSGPNGTYLLTASPWAGEGGSFPYTGGDLDWPFSNVIDFPRPSGLVPLNFHIPIAGRGYSPNELLWIERAWSRNGYDLIGRVSVSRYIGSPPTISFLYFVNLTSPGFLDVTRAHDVAPSMEIPWDAPLGCCYFERATSNVLFNVRIHFFGNTYSFEYVFYDIANSTGTTFTAPSYDVEWQQRRGDLLYLLMATTASPRPFERTYIFVQVDLGRARDFGTLAADAITELWRKTFWQDYTNYYPVPIVHNDSLTVLEGSGGYEPEWGPRFDLVTTYGLLNGSMQSQEVLNLREPRFRLRDVTYPRLPVRAVYGSYLLDLEGGTVVALNLTDLETFLFQRTGRTQCQYCHYDLYATDYNPSRVRLFGLGFDYSAPSRGWFASVEINIGNPPPNEPPSAAFAYTPTAYAGATITFNASASEDVDGVIQSYLWDFGDGSTGVGRTVDHRYASPGPRTVALTVTSNGGLSGTTAAVVVVHALVPHDNRAGFRMPVPEDWGLRTDLPDADLRLVGPTYNGTRALVLVASYGDPGATEDVPYLEARASALLAEIQMDHPDAVFAASPSYRTIAGHRAYVSIVSYDSGATMEKIAIVASAEHEHFWVLRFAISDALFGAMETVFNQMIDGFVITRPTPAEELTVAIGILGACGLAALVPAVLLTWWPLRRARARRQAQSRPAARGTSAACPGCGALAVDDGRFCWKCGTALPAAPPQPSAPPAPPHL